jgi:hypothetical protein
MLLGQKNSSDILQKQIHYFRKKVQKNQRLIIFLIAKPSTASQKMTRLFQYFIIFCAGTQNLKD